MVIWHPRQERAVGAAGLRLLEMVYAFINLRWVRLGSGTLIDLRTACNSKGWFCATRAAQHNASRAAALALTDAVC